MKFPQPDWSDERGRVLLYRADARELLPRLPDASVDMVFTDPPYGHNNNNKGLIANRESALGLGVAGPPRPIQGDGPQEAHELFALVCQQAPRLLADGSCCCCCGGGGGPDPQFGRWSLMLDDAMTFKQAVVWDKGPMGMGWHYRRSYEMVLVAQKGKGKCRWYDSTHRVENVIRNVRKIIPAKDQHPTEKPIELPMRFIRNHSWTHHWVLDPFMGSGSTAEAAVRLGRRFIGCEIDRKWFNHTRRRLGDVLLSRGGRLKSCA